MTSAVGNLIDVPESLWSSNRSAREQYVGVGDASDALREAFGRSEIEGVRLSFLRPMMLRGTCASCA
jgi:hypothetical protein